MVSGVARTYAEFIQTHLQGCLDDISVFLFSNFHLAYSFSIFLFGDNICILGFQAPSSEGKEEGEGEEEEIPSPHHAGSSFSSFMETYPHFLA